MPVVFVFESNVNRRLDKYIKMAQKHFSVSVSVILVFSICVCFSENISSSKDSEVSENDSNMGQYDELTGSVEYFQNHNTDYTVAPHLRIKRQRGFPVYTCKRNSCSNGVCKPEYYEGPKPPDWCRNGKPHSKQTKCSWTKSCWNRQCETQSTSCRHEFEDHTKSKAQQKSTFNFECRTRENICNVVTCRGINNCGRKNRITMKEFENEFLNRLPNCNHVDRNGMRGKRGIDNSVPLEMSRVQRSPFAFESLKGYCCEIADRWDGVKIASVRPIIS